MKKYVIIIFLTLFSSQILFAQDEDRGDFLVSNTGDTLYGKFKKKLFDEPSFIINGEKVPLDPTQYAAYSYKHTLFRSIQLSPNVNPQWMECLENGKICLYQYLMLSNARPGQQPINRVIWLAQKGSGTLMNVNGIMSSETIARGNLDRLFIDNPTILNAFRQSKFSAKNIRYFIQQYNLAK
ncbi:hypothetical protein [Arachidicoccus ginsenosidimutans]|uniref:hypothetical protein n=1 Tax=Arachidicoccus sp. BS20 TaxID=1850526 RepID=UPI0012E8B1CB|nr:hypothetical protein [Arachidicoccus sp. BS20]